MEPDGIALSEISQAEKTNTVLCHLYVESEKTELVKMESRMVVTGPEMEARGELE